LFYICSFLGTLLPAGELDQEFVLLQGGLSSADARLDPVTRSLIKETVTYVTSADFGTVFGACLDRVTDILIQGLREGVFEGGQEDDDSKVEKHSVRLAAMLPAVARWSHLAVNGIPNPLVEVRMGASDVCNFGCYSVFD
jgi:peroxin-3